MTLNSKDIIVDFMFVSDLKEIMSKNPDANYKADSLKEKVSKLSNDVLIMAKYTINSPITYIDIQEADSLI